MQCSNSSGKIVYSLPRAYNVGPFRLLGKGKIPKSTLIRKLEVGDRNIYRFLQQQGGTTHHTAQKEESEICTVVRIKRTDNNS